MNGSLFKHEEEMKRKEEKGEEEEDGEDKEKRPLVSIT